jgi:hypothetical protein
MFEGDDLAEKFVLGDPFHQSYLSTYDLEYKYVGFAPHPFSNSTITTSRLTKGSMIVAIIVGSIIGLVIISCVISLSKEWVRFNGWCCKCCRKDEKESNNNSGKETEAIIKNDANGVTPTPP